MAFENLVLTFCDSITKEDEYDIPFKLHDNVTARKWIEMLHTDITTNGCTWSNNRFVGFDVDETKKSRIASEINDILSICDMERPGFFNQTITEDLKQENMNKVHLFVENFRGNYDHPHQFFEEGTEEFQTAIERLNQVIHEWEAIQNGHGPYVEVDFYGIGGTQDIEDDDRKHFAIEKYDDTIYLSYNMRGKSILSVCVDDDDDVGGHNIQPYKYIKSNFMFVMGGWGEEKTTYYNAKFNSWFKRNDNYLNSLGFYRDDPKITAGNLPLAYSLISDTKSIVETRQFLKKIEVF